MYVFAYMQIMCYCIIYKKVELIPKININEKNAELLKLNFSSRYDFSVGFDR